MPAKTLQVNFSARGSSAEPSPTHFSGLRARRIRGICNRSVEEWAYDGEGAVPRLGQRPGAAIPGARRRGGMPCRPWPMAS